jgi:hypothetical protein
MNKDSQQLRKRETNTTMTLDTMPDLLKPTEAAKLLRTTTNTLQQDRYLRRGVPYIKVGHRVLYARNDILAYLTANRSEPAA